MIIDGHEMTVSHGEADIYKGCVALMQELMSRFEEYLDFIGVEPKENYDDEERFCTHVLAHWQSIADGNVPFGYTVKED